MAENRHDQGPAELYDGETRVLVQAVKRNLDRFPGDFIFQLANRDVAALRSQSVISKPGRGGRQSASAPSPNKAYEGESVVWPLLFMPGRLGVVATTVPQADNRLYYVYAFGVIWLGRW